MVPAGACGAARPVRAAWPAIALLVALPGFAQEGERAGTDGHAIDEIVVVGSLIRRTEVYEGRAPVQSLDASTFEAVGAAQPVDILPSLTANTGSYVATEQSYLQGVSQFSLRGVGLSSTLTLVNGRRAGFAPVSDDVGQSFFDINTLPVLMIDRVEILRDGASATYGSQAVAGVANIVTRRGFTGLEIAGGYRDATNRAYDLGFASGFETARGHVNLYGAWYEQDENFRTDFDWMIPRVIDPDGDGDIVDGSFDSGRGSPGSFRRAVANPDGTYAPYQVGGLDTPRFPDPDCRAGGGYPSDSLCRVDFSDQRTMVAAERRVQLFAEAAGEHSGDEVRTFDNLRMMVGLEAELPGGWTGEGYVSRARSDLSVSSERHWIAAEFARAVSEGVWNPFGTRLVAPDLVTPKTVADDGLAPAWVGRRAANEPETLDRFEGVRTDSARSVQSVAEFVATGDVLEWRGRPVALAAGAQYRELDYRFRPDPLNAAGEGPRRIRDFPRAADQQVWAVFAESLAYVGDRAELQVAARHERYDHAGSSTDPKIAGQFFVSDRLSLRASWGTSFQAPSVFQVVGNTSSRTLTDPFRFDGQGAGRCSVDASGAIVNRGDNFAVTTMLRGGGLSPQSARSTNFGMLVKPLDNAAVSLDYWALDYRDVIARGQSFQAIVDEDCRDDGQPNDARVQRDSSGQLSVVTTDYENVGAVRARGIDLNAYYDLDTAVVDFRVSADATLLTRFDVNAGGMGFVDRLGSRNDTNGFAPTPELRFNLGLAWRQGRHAAGATVRYVDSYANDEVASLPEIASWTTLDANYSYLVEDLFGGEVTFQFGARNLTDRNPPPLPSGREGVYRHNLRPGFDGFVHDIKGRTLYVRFLYRPRS